MSLRFKTRLRTELKERRWKSSTDRKLHSSIPIVHLLVCYEQRLSYSGSLLLVDVHRRVVHLTPVRDLALRLSELSFLEC